MKLTKNKFGVRTVTAVAALLIVASLLCLGFSYYALRLCMNYSDALARKTFRFSLIHLSGVFAALLIDHYIVA